VVPIYGLTGRIFNVQFREGKYENIYFITILCNSIRLCIIYSMKKRNLTIKVYDSFEQEEKAETQRRSKKTSKECLDEFVILQRRVLGDNWCRQKMVRTITFEKVTW